jgi:hypothetical protein
VMALKAGASADCFFTPCSIVAAVWARREKPAPLSPDLWTECAATRQSKSRRYQRPRTEHRGFSFSTVHQD